MAETDVSLSPKVSLVDDVGSCMNRRALLASIGGGTGGAFAGCLDHGSEGTGGGSPDDGDGNASPGTGSDETGGDGTEIDETDGSSGTNESDETGGTNGTGGIDETDGTDGNGDGASVPEPDGECGSEADPLSSVLLDGGDQNEGVCHEDLTPSFVVANERDDAVTAAVEIASEEEPIFEGSYSLKAGECAVEQDVGVAADLESVTVALEGGAEFSGEWADTVCYRHATILAEEGSRRGTSARWQAPATPSTTATRAILSRSSCAARRRGRRRSRLSITAGNRSARRPSNSKKGVSSA